MAVVAATVDYLIKEYLVFRGFTGTIKIFESETKADKNKSFQVDSIVNQFVSSVHNYDIASLRKYWKYFDSSYFNQLGHDTYKVIKKLENDLLKLYIVHAIQSNRMEKVNEFFEKYALELQQEDSWKNWFVLPFVKNPEQSRVFAMYFTKVWQDSILLSLGNCLDTVFCNLALPALLDFEKEAKKIEKLEEENLMLKEQLLTYQKELSQLHHHMKAGKTSTGTQTVEIETTDDISSRSKKKSPSSKPKFAAWFLSKDKDNTKVTKKDGNNKENKLLKGSLDESAFRKMRHVPFQRAESHPIKGKRESADTTSNSSLEEGNSATENDPSTQFYVPLDDKPTEDATTSTGGVPDVTSDAISVENSFCGGSTDKPFILLSQDELKEHTSSVVTSKFSDNGNTVASLDASGVVKIWQCHPSISSPAAITLKSDYASLDWVPKLDGKLLLGKSNGQISLYDVNSQKKVLWETTAHAKFKRVNTLACSPISATAVCSVVAMFTEPKKSSTNSQQKFIRMKQYSSHHNPANAREGSLSLWDLQTAQKKSDLSLDPYPVCIHSLSYNHNGTLVVTGGADGMIRLFDIRNNDCIIGWHAHTINVLDVKFNPNETCIYSMGAEGKLCVWDVNKVSSKIAEFPLHSGSTGSYYYSNMNAGNNVDDIPNSKLMACDSEGDHLMTCAPSGLMIYKAKPLTVMEELMHVVCGCSEVLTLDWMSSPNCSMAMCGTRKGTVQISTLMKR